MLWNIVRCLPFQDAKSVSDVAVKVKISYFTQVLHSAIQPFCIKIVDAEIFIFVSYNLHLFEKKSKI